MSAPDAKVGACVTQLKEGKGRSSEAERDGTTKVLVTTCKTYSMLNGRVARRRCHSMPVLN